MTTTLHTAEIATLLYQRGLRPDSLNTINENTWQATFVNPGGMLNAVLDAQMERLDADPLVLLDIRRARHAWWVTFQEVGR